MLAKPNTKEYGIPSVVFQLYCSPVLNFKLPPTVFYPQPKVDSALMTLDFNKPLHPTLVYEVNPAHLRAVLSHSFHMRRKMLRHSLRELIAQLNQQRVAQGTEQGGSPAVDYSKEIALSEYWEMKRPEQLHPLEFVQLTRELYGSNTTAGRLPGDVRDFWGKRVEPNSADSKCREAYYTPPAWRSSTSAGGRTVHKEGKEKRVQEE